jgi:hypothetical protein
LIGVLEDLIVARQFLQAVHEQLVNALVGRFLFAARSRAAGQASEERIERNEESRVLIPRTEVQVAQNLVDGRIELTRSRTQKAFSLTVALRLVKNFAKSGRTGTSAALCLALGPQGRFGFSRIPLKSCLNSRPC